MVGAQLATLEVDVELLGEAVDGEGGHLAGVGVDVGQVVAGVVEFASAGQDQSTAGAGVGTNVAVKLPCGTGNPTLTYPWSSCR